HRRPGHRLRRPAPGQPGHRRPDVHRHGLPGVRLHPGGGARPPAAGAGRDRGRLQHRVGPALDGGPHDPGGPRRARDVGPCGVSGHQFSRVHGRVREYEVFARKLRVEPLRLIGSVVAPDDDLAAAYARATYDEERWVEMAIVPRDAMTILWAPGEESD